ncbi:MAG: alanine racemase [Anaerolineaceae bacterium]|nr:alanine racemase [Anaerolineaceae bacterium]
MISLYDFLNAANGQLFGEPAAQLFTNFSLDPYLADESDLFVALQSERGNSHDYIAEAIRRGVAGVVCTYPPDCETDGVSVIMVRDPFDAMMAWSRFVLKKYQPHIVAIAGSCSKSVTAQATTLLLKQTHQVHRGSINTTGRLNLPLSIAGMRPDDEYLVIKLDVEKPGDMAAMLDVITPEIAILTHIDCHHPAAFTDCDQYVQEMQSLVEAVSEEGLVVLNMDDTRVAPLIDVAQAEVRTIAMEAFGTDLMAYNILPDIARTGFDLRYGSERYVARWIPLLSKLHLYSALASLAVALHAGLPIDAGLRALTKLKPLPGRISPLRAKEGAIVIDDSYAANVLSTEAALMWLKDIKYDHQVMVILGELDDHSEHSQVAHRNVGKEVADVADVLITLGGEAAQAARSAIDHGMDSSRVFTAYSWEEAVSFAQHYGMSENDIIYVKGGRLARMETVVRAQLADKSDEVYTVRYVPDEADKSTSPTQSLFPSWVEVDTDTIANNIQIIKSMLADDVALCAVVKANAYGHGAVSISRIAASNGADYLAVASIAEALELRDAGIKFPILVLTYTPLHAIRQAVRANLTVTVFDLEQARAYDRAVRDMNTPLKYQVKIDTGMGRLGVLVDDALHMFRYLDALSHLELEGIYTHFSVADEDLSYTSDQAFAFKRIVQAVRASGFSFKYAHAANSAGMLQGPDFHFNMVRPGIVSYGVTPAPHMALPDGIRPALTWKTTVLQVKTLPPGHAVGYGNAYHTSEAEKIAILPVGYADGLRRSPRSWKEVLIRGQRAPLVGRVSMEKCAVSVQEIPGVTAGDEVVLLGQQGDDAITADEIAHWLGTINYEVLTSVLRHVPRKA